MTDKGSLLSSNLSIRFFAAILLTILYGIFLWDSYWGLGFTIVNAALIGILLIVRPEVNNKKSLIFLGASLILSAFIPLRGFWFDRFVTFFFVYLLDVLAIVQANRPDSKPLTLKSLAIIPLLVGFNSFVEIVSLPKRIKDLVLKQRVSPEGISQTNLTTGILIGIPLVFLFALILSSADPVFARYLNDFFSRFSLDFSTIKRVVEIIFFFGLFSSLLGNIYQNAEEFGMLLKNSKFQKEIAIASVFIVILLGLFLIVQGEFLFAGEALLKQLNLTLSEYTRNGYEQLLIVSSISLFLIYILTGKGENSGSVFLKTVTAAFILEIFLLLLSATYRVYLYQHNFGLTELRLLGILFSIWLVGALGLSVFRFTGKTPTNSFFHFLFINAVLVVLLMNLTNIDFIVATYKKPNLGVGIDYPYIAGLSSDAWPAWSEVLDYLETSKDCSAGQPWAISSLKSELYVLTNDRTKNSWHNFGAWTYPDSQALTFLSVNSARIDKLMARYEGCQPGGTPTLPSVQPTSVPDNQLQAPPIATPGQFSR